MVTDKSENKMVVSPPEAAEASANSSHVTSESNNLATCWQFDPPPKYSPDWWQENDSDGTFSHDVNFEPGALNPEGWVVTWTFSPMSACLSAGYWPNPYPTATDALLWLRLQVLPQIGFDPQGGNVPADLISRIDHAPPGTDAAALLNELKPMLVREFPGIGESAGIEIISIYTVHEWLSTWGTPEEFRKCYGTDEITCEHGRWTMPKLWWDRLVYDLANNEMEYLSVPNGQPSEPWPPDDESNPGH
jgi:hypothetical protein